MSMLWSVLMPVWGIDGWTIDGQTKDVVPPLLSITHLHVIQCQPASFMNTHNIVQDLCNSTHMDVFVQVLFDFYRLLVMSPV